MLATRNMKLYLPFERNANDFSGNGNNGTVSGASLVDGGKFGKCYSFDGVDDYISIPSVSIGLGSTISMWINLYQVSGIQYIVGSYARGIRYNGSTLLYITSNNGWSTLNYTAVDEMVFLTCVRTIANKIKWYINSEYLGQTTCGNTSDLEVEYLGRMGFSPFYYFDGILENILVYNVELSSTDIKRIMLNLHPLNG